jgi:hypothetical protein
LSSLIGRIQLETDRAGYCRETARSNRYQSEPGVRKIG